MVQLHYLHTVIWNSRGQHEYIYLFTVSNWSLPLMPVIHSHLLKFLAYRSVSWLNDTFYSKMSEEVNRKCRPRNTTVQLSTPYSYPEQHNAQRHWQSDRQTGQTTVSCQYQYSRSYCVQYDRLKRKSYMTYIEPHTGRIVTLRNFGR